MDNNNYMNETVSSVGIPYDDINWYDIEGQPFGIGFNAIVFNDAYNLLDVEGAMAVGGNFNSPRGISVGFGRNSKLAETGYSPDLVRFLAGSNVSTGGPLVATGHVVTGGNFHVAKGSTYLIGKNGANNQAQQLEYLYQAVGGSPYWHPSDKGNHYLISSYDVPRYIPSGRIRANLPLFFQNARESIVNYKNCIDNLEVNASVIDDFHEWVLRGNDPKQNVFLIDVRPNGRLNKGIRAEVPEGSLVIVKLRTGNNAHLQYGILGEQRHANHTLYVFEDANDIYMEVPADIWGSILAPQAMFHAHSTGGHVSGNVAFRSFAVNANSGFEFHLYPFVGGVNCQMPSPTLPEESMIAPIEEIQCPICPSVPICPEQQPCPIPKPCPEAQPCPVCPEQQPCQACPEQQPCEACPICPEQQPCPEVQPCPVCPEQQQCPEVQPCPVCPEQQPCEACPVCPEQQPCPICPEPKPCPVCPEQQPCQACPVCPEQQPCPICPEPEPCPVCPTCPTLPEQMPYIEYVPYPVPIPYPTYNEQYFECPECPNCPECPEYPECPECPECQECLIIPGIIAGCIWGCNCCKIHEWEVKLCSINNDKKILLCCETVPCCGCFEFEVPYDGVYLLEFCPIGYSKRSGKCRPIVSMKNVGVSNLIIK